MSVKSQAVCRSRANLCMATALQATSARHFERCRTFCVLPTRQIVEEIASTRITERGASRVDDRFSEAAMEDRKREGYF